MKKRHHSARGLYNSSHKSADGYRSMGREEFDKEPMSDSHHDLAASRYGDRMIREDHRAIANLPQEVMIKAYPVMPGYTPEGLNDTIDGVDHAMEGDHKSAMRGLNPMKF